MGYNIDNIIVNLKKQIQESGGGGGTSDYSQLTNKPQINEVTLSGNKSLSDLGIASASDLEAVEALIPESASTSNQLATASDISDSVVGNPSGSATAGNLTKLQIGSDIYNVPSGSGSGESFSTSERDTGGVWIDGKEIYSKVVPLGQLPATPSDSYVVAHNVASGAKFIKYDAIIYNQTNSDIIPLPSIVAAANGITITVDATNITIKSGVDRSNYTSGHVILYYTKGN